MSKAVCGGLLVMCLVCCQWRHAQARGKEKELKRMVGEQEGEVARRRRAVVEVEEQQEVEGVSECPGGSDIQKCLLCVCARESVFVCERVYLRVFL